MIHLDTSFLIDLMRERRRGERGAAVELLLSLGEAADLAISVHAVCELLAGAERARQPARERREIAALLAHLAIVSPGADFPVVYARLYAHLEGQGRRIGTMDLLIATAAVEGGAPLVTADRRHFTRVPDLELIGS